MHTQLVRELAAALPAEISDDVIADFLEQAVADLNGSVRHEALPEMASRLAYHRLAGRPGESYRTTAS